MSLLVIPGEPREARRGKGIQLLGSCSLLRVGFPSPSRHYRVARPGMTIRFLIFKLHDVLLVGFQKPPHDGCSNDFQRNAPAQRLRLVVTRIPARIRHTPAGCTTTARGRFPGSRVVTVARLPRALPAQVACGRPLAGHSCGGSRGITAFPKPRTWADLSAGKAARQCLRFARFGLGDILSTPLLS
jgi:hypothetical protein